MTTCRRYIQTAASTYTKNNWERGRVFYPFFCNNGENMFKYFKAKTNKKELQKIFDTEIGQMLASKGFEWKDKTYYRIVNGEILQMVIFGRPDSRTDTDIIFDMMPLYSNIPLLDYVRKIGELPCLNVTSAVNASREFDLHMAYFKNNLMDTFDKVKDSESLLAFRTHWAKIEEDCHAANGWGDNEGNEYTEEEAAFAASRYPALKDVKGELWLDFPTVYTALRCGKYELAAKEIQKRYYTRKAGEEYQLHKKLISEKNYQRQLIILDEIFKNELEILNALDNKDFRRINQILEANIDDNIQKLESKIGIKF